MRRTHRIGAAVAAAATLMTGAGFALASLRTAPPPVDVTPVSDTESATGGEDLDATVRQLRGEADDLQSKIDDREKAARLARDGARNATAGDQADPTTPAATPTTTAPTTDFTTGASGAREDERDDEGKGDDD
jgi:hypothetical protein